ncbi:MAG: hypothetical protein ACRDTV_08465 [Mycobacterium sp.]
MNRAERRRHARQNKYRVRLGYGNPTPANIRQATQCPDCNSNVTIIEIQPGRYRGQVAHDDTCPWYAQLKRDLS